jgi:hypothetical protein
MIARQQGIQADLLPSTLMSYGSDQAILQFLLDAKPDLVGWSCYQWNIERSLFVGSSLERPFREKSLQPPFVRGST